jgi:FlaA1/EpsC-like NDP-sugar epimerase
MRGVRIEPAGPCAGRFDAASIRQTLQGRCVLVTGAGGSIGSEIARQVAAASPSTLVLVDRAESDLYDIECDIRRAHPALTLEAAVTDILDAPDVDAVFAAHRPARVYHAAAYKHVPLMERHAVAAARNNVIGTAVVAEAALKYGAERFVLLSSDKAVRPTSLMGATKRAAERVVLALTGGATLFTAVRFGNVLASRAVSCRCSRSRSRPEVRTVTDPEVVRYFMTVQEAVHLVLRASIDGAGGEIFHLDMGESVRIADLAEQLIRLSGLEPGIDIEIKYTGLRPGEKLLEELLVEGDTVEPTRHPKIFTLRERLLPLSREWIADLSAAVTRRDADRIIALLRLAAPEYAPGHGASLPR